MVKVDLVTRAGSNGLSLSAGCRVSYLRGGFMVPHVDVDADALDVGGTDVATAGTVVIRPVVEGDVGAELISVLDAVADIVGLGEGVVVGAR